MSEAKEKEGLGNLFSAEPGLFNCIQLTIML